MYIIYIYTVIYCIYIYYILNYNGYKFVEQIREQHVILIRPVAVFEAPKPWEGPLTGIVAGYWFH